MAKGTTLIRFLCMLFALQLTGCGAPPPPPPPKVSKNDYEKMSLAISKATTTAGVEKILAKGNVTMEEWQNACNQYGAPRWARKQMREQMKKAGVPESDLPPLEDPPPASPSPK